MHQQSQQRRATLALCLGSWVVFANLYSTQPLLPMLAEHFVLTELQSAWALTIATLALSVSFLVYGPLSDMLGRKRIMVATLIGMTVVSWAMIHVQSFNQLLWLRGIQGFLLGGLPAIAVAYMGEEFRTRTLAAAIGLYISANSLGGISGRVLSGAIAHYWDWHSVFITLLIINIAVTLFVALTLPRSQQFTPRAISVKNIISPLWLHLRHHKLLIAYVIGGLHFMVFLNQYSYIVFVLAEAPYSLPSSLLGLLFLTYLSGSLSAAMTGKIDKHLSPPQCIITGSVLMMLGTLLTLAPLMTMIIGGLLVMAFGFFLAHSTLTRYVSQQAAQAKASASSLYLVFYYFGASVGGIYLYPFWSWQHWPGVVAGSLLVLTITTALGHRLKNARKSAPQPLFEKTL